MVAKQQGCGSEMADKVKVAISCTGDCWHSKFFALIFYIQAAVQQHMKEIYYLEASV